MARSRRGIFLVLALFAVGLLMLWGLFLAPRAVSPPAPPNVAWGVPDRPLRFVSFNILHNQRGIERVCDKILKQKPDFVFLQEVESRDVIELASRLGMETYHHPRLYQPSFGPKSTWGDLVLSRHPIYEAAAIPNPGGGNFGVWATAVVDEKKFMVASVHLSATWKLDPIHIKNSGENRNRELTALAKAWRDRGSPPIVIGGDFNQIPMGNNWSLMTATWTDALGSLGHDDITFGEGLLHTRIDYFLLSPSWQAQDGEVAGASGASDHRLIRVDLAGTDPATRPAPMR